MSTRRRRILAMTMLEAAALLSMFNGPIGAPAGASTAATPGNAPLTATALITQGAISQAQSGIVAVDTQLQTAAPRTNTHDLPATPLPVSGLPDTAWYAYQRAASVMASVKPDCHMDWSLLAAIGQVESDHGRSGGATLRSDGTSTPPVRGVELNGKGSVQKIRDTDNGAIDGDKTWDRAVGPMQFLPSTWLVVGVDGDGDGRRSSDDIDDASLAAGVYLCGWHDDLSTVQGLRHAIYRYNPSLAYVSAVLAQAQIYRSATGQIFTAGLFTTPSAWAALPSALPTGAQSDNQDPKTFGTPSHGSRPSPPALPTDYTNPKPPIPSSPPATGTSSPTADPAPTPAPTPTPDTTPTPDATPSPAPGDTPGETPTPDPDPSTGGITTLSGTLTSCGASFCVDNHQLGLGSLDSDSGHDFDGDSSVETKRAELDGLAGTQVVLELERGTDPAIVRTLNGSPWP